MGKELLCTKCGYQGKGKNIVPGNFAIELVLWLCFLLPGLIYTIWRSSKTFKGCPTCKERMIPLESPVAQKFITNLKV